MPKGDVLATARLAGIQAAKRTHEWIPLAHALALDAVEVHFDPLPAAGGEEACLRIEARVRAQARTGVEMEALVAVSAAALTLYDMCKARRPRHAHRGDPPGLEARRQERRLAPPRRGPAAGQLTFASRSTGSFHRRCG